MTLFAAAKAVTAAPPSGLATHGDAQTTLDQLPIGVLAAHWCALQHLGLKQRTDESQAAMLYFDRLAHDAPGRTFDLVLEVLRTEDDVNVRMELGNHLADALITRHADALIDRIEAEASRNSRLRWLLGGTYWWARGRAVRARLGRVADEEAWRAADVAHAARGLPINFEALTTSELARVWVEEKAKPSKDRDRNWSALAEFERDLLDRDPDAVLDLVLAVVAIETHPAVLSLLAAGLLEGVLSLKLIDRIARHAAENDRFRALLGRVWSWNEPAELRTRLAAVVDDRR
jgi:hypothetical protein